MMNSLSTVRKARAMNQIVYRVVLGFVIGATIISFVICTGLCISNALVNLLKKTGDLKFDVTPIYASLFIVYISISIFQVVIFTSSGIRLIQTIKKNKIKANNTSSQSFIQLMNSPYTKILLLVTGILLCMGILMLSVAMSIVTSLYLPNYHIIDYFLHGFGVSVFAGIVLFTYSPIWANKANSCRRQSMVSAVSPLDFPTTDDFTSPTTPTTDLSRL